MAEHTPPPFAKADKAETNRHLMQYVTGFILSVILSLIAYFYATTGLGGWSLMLSLTAMAVVQVILQLVFFLHMRDEAEPRWRLLAFNLALLLLAILVFGTLWIMRNLDRHMLTPQKSNDYNHFIVKDEGFGK